MLSFVSQCIASSWVYRVVRRKLAQLSSARNDQHGGKIVFDSVCRQRCAINSEAAPVTKFTALNETETTMLNKKLFQTTDIFIANEGNEQEHIDT
jgi:hypothetical protein